MEAAVPLAGTPCARKGATLLCGSGPAALVPYPKWSRWLGCATRNPAVLGRKVRRPLRKPPTAIGEANAPTPLNSNCVSIVSILDKMQTHFILPESLIL